MSSWGFSGRSVPSHFRNWKCFTGQLSFRCWHKCFVLLRQHITPAFTVKLLGNSSEHNNGHEKDQLWCYLNMSDQHGAVDESWSNFCTRNFYLNISKCLLFFTPVDGFIILSGREPKTRSFTLSTLWACVRMHVERCIVLTSLCSESMTIEHIFFWQTINQKSPKVFGSGSCVVIRACGPQ